MIGSVRTVLPLTYNGRTRDLKVTFGLIDKVRRVIPWEKLALDMSRTDNINPDFAMMSRFVYMNLVEAGFPDEELSIDDIYDAMIDEDGESLIQLAANIIVAYQPRGKKKKPLIQELDKKQTKKKHA